jgi:hypothetical protein
VQELLQILHCTPSTTIMKKKWSDILKLLQENRGSNTSVKDTGIGEHSLNRTPIHRK